MFFVGFLMSISPSSAPISSKIKSSSHFCFYFFFNFDFSFLRPNPVSFCFFNLSSIGLVDVKVALRDVWAETIDIPECP